MAEQPNILFIFPDQWRYDAFSHLDHPVALTPYMDDIAAEAVSFTAAYSNCPICIPARACMVTGQTPNTVGRFGWRDHVSFAPYAPSLITRLRDGGYQTMLAGKTHFYPRRLRLGFEELDLADGRRDDTSHYEHWLNRETRGQVRASLQVLHGNALITEPWVHPLPLHRTEYNTRRALEMLEQRDPTRPFFLNFAPLSPHPPFDPPLEFYERFADVEIPDPPMGDWAERFDVPTVDTMAETGRFSRRQYERIVRGYYASCAHVDAQIGQLMTYLRRTGQWDDTLVIFSSDHGEQLGDHGLFRKSTPLQGSLAVPMIVKPPKSWESPRGVTCGAPVALHDILPTCLDVGGIPIPEKVEGLSFAPCLHNPDTWTREYVHAEQSGSPFGGWQCLTDGRVKYIWNPRNGEEHFFDLENDLWEERNLAGDPDYADTMARWRERLVRQLADRPEDRMSEGKVLTPGGGTAAVRPWLLEAASE